MNYGGDNIGNEWQYEIRVDNVQTVVFPRHLRIDQFSSLGHLHDWYPENENGTSTIISGESKLGESHEWNVDVTATESTIGEPGRRSETIAFISENHQIRKDAVVDGIEVPGYQSQQAMLDFTFRFSSKCNEKSASARH